MFVRQDSTLTLNQQNYSWYMAFPENYLKLKSLLLKKSKYEFFRISIYFSKKSQNSLFLREHRLIRYEKNNRKTINDRNH